MTGLVIAKVAVTEDDVIGTNVTMILIASGKLDRLFNMDF